MLPDPARDSLRRCAQAGGDLDVVAAGLRATWPEHFHSEASLAERRFYHRPVDGRTGKWADLPMAGYVSEARVA